MATKFDVNTKGNFQWAAGAEMRAFLHHIAKTYEHGTISSLLSKAVIHYASRVHHESFQSFTRELRCNEMLPLEDIRQQLVIAQGMNQELRYRLREMRGDLRDLQQKARLN